MATIINADTSAGLKLTSDTSGEIKLQSAGTDIVSVTSSGNVLLNKTDTSHTSDTGQVFFGSGTSFYVNNHSSTGTEAVLFNSLHASGAYNLSFRVQNSTKGSIVVSSSGTAYNTSSDYRLKENVVPMTGSIDRLKALKPFRFNFIADADTTVDGFLAHEAGEVVPEAISGEKDAMRTEEYEVTPAVLDDDGNVVTEAVMGTREVPDYQGIDQAKLVPLLTAALQEAITKIEDLETRIQVLENA